MAGGAGRRGLPTATLLGLLALLAGPVAAADGDSLSIENQLYITAGLLGGLSLVLTIAVVYLLLALNRIQSDVLSLKDSMSQQKQEKQPPTTQRKVDVKDPEDQHTQMQLPPVSQPPPASQHQSQPTSQLQSQPTPQSQPDPQRQINDARNRSYQQQISYQPPTSPGNTSAPLHQQSYGGPPYGALSREPSYGGAPVAAYGFPAQAPQRTALPEQHNQSTLFGDGPYRGRPSSSHPAPYHGSRLPTSPNAYDSSRSVYSPDRY